MKKLALILPGVGYNSNRPLLYFAKKIAAAFDYESLEVSYKDIPFGLRDCPERLLAAEEEVCRQSYDFLSSCDLSSFNKILFISKSIGTCAAASLSERLSEEGKISDFAHILYTPLEKTFDFGSLLRACAFGGSADPWIDIKVLEKLCKKTSVPLEVYDKANHSLETGDVLRDLTYLKDVMEKSRNFIEAFSNEG